jgi:hypothetical protein
LSALRAEQALDVHAAQRRRIDAMPEMLRASVADEVRCRVRVAVGMTIETRHTGMRALAVSIARLSDTSGRP